MIRSILLALLTGSALLFLSSCLKIPIAPDNPTPEPDTAKSFFRAFVIAPEFNTVITVRNNDTLSNGKIPQRNENGVWEIRDGGIIKSNLVISDFNTSMALNIIYNFNLTLLPYPGPNN
jgi:hypothetical protein